MSGIFECKEIPKGPFGDQRPWDLPTMRPPLDNGDRFPTDAQLPRFRTFRNDVDNVRKD